MATEQPKIINLENKLSINEDDGQSESDTKKNSENWTRAKCDKNEGNSLSINKGIRR